MMTESDETLMKRVTAGNASAFQQLVTRHLDRYYRLAYRILLHKEDAEDVAQQAFLKLWNGKARWQPGRGTRFTTWFHRIVVNQALDLKRRQPLQEIYEDTLTGGANAEVIAMDNQKQHHIREALKGLSKKQRAAVTLFYLEEMSQKEVARTMKLSEKAVESLLTRGRQALKSQITEEYISGGVKEQSHG